MFSPLVRVGSRVQRRCRCPVRTAKARNYAVSSTRDPLLKVGLEQEGPAKTWNVSGTKVEKTELEGGVTVLSVDTPVPISSLSLYVKAGTRYETRKSVGSAHFLKHLAFRNTHQKSGLRLYRDLEHVGARLTTHFEREHMVYHITGPRLPDHVSDLTPLDITVESLRYLMEPTLQEWEIAAIRPIVASETEHLNRTDLVLNRVHEEAFRDSGLGQPLYCPSYAIKSVDGNGILYHLYHNYFPGSQVTIVGTGIEHQRLVSALSRQFVNIQLCGSFFELPQTPALNEKVAHPASTYNGGQNVRIPGSGGTTLAIAYPGVASTHPDAAVFRVLREAFGQASPNLPIGSGASSLLNRTFNNSKDFTINSIAFNITYSDAGLFGIIGNASAGNAAKLAGALSQFLANPGLTNEDLARAQQQLKAKLFRRVLEDNKQLADLVHKTTSIGQFLQKVDAVTLSDLQRVAKSLQSSQPTVVSAGDVRGVPLRL